ncbi:hypothetical protein K503DRAFT_767558 [Rhizopogon vinicolor AM-OR11-026]|uniref:CENP-C homolog n=1 Tax=Rhizopogon vinicolor AM-OR11-026 TaxID=1314800 RepID=A0A1B7N9K9_9AGAM|nr:hypothetical protein K503DRAFT_767558 [Rhizopogon vinicolor AM-OR11-026]
MPRESTERRKSSIGSRRGPPKKHIPFRADDLRLGKKTGIAVQYVGRDSDEFEPFDELMKQADDRTPPRVKSRKKRVSVAAVPEYDEYDEDGEMSMELAESNQGSPLAYFTHAPTALAPNSARKLGSSRSVPRTSAIDFDEVPSPRMRSAPSRRASAVNGAGPSALSKSFSVYNDAHDQDQDLAPDPDFEPANQDFDYEPPMNETPSRTGISFNHVNNDDEEEDDAAEVEEEVTSRAKKVNKGKQRAVAAVEEQDETAVEDDIAQGLEEIENAPDEEEGEEDPPPKKLRKDDQKEQKPKKPRARAPKRVVISMEENSPAPDGVRRSRRYKYKPLEYWRQEKVVYGRPESGLALVPQIKEIVRIPQEPPKPLGKAAKKRKRAGSERAKSSNPQSYDPEKGWDDNTPENGVVIDWVTQEPVSRRIVYTAKKVDPKAAAGGEWFFQKVFGEGDYIAGGILRIPPTGRKPSKGTKDNTYVFYVIEGAVAAVIHGTQYTVATGGMFIVPRGNTYYIENVSDRDARIFFTQARQMRPDEDIDIQLDHVSHSAPPSSRLQRSSGSAAPPPLAKRGKSTKA